MHFSQASVVTEPRHTNFLPGYTGTDQCRAAYGKYVPVLGISPLMGRAFTQQEDDDSRQVAVLELSDLARSLRRRSPRTGPKVLLDRKPYEIIGVMPREFEFPLVPGRVEPVRALGTHELHAG